MARRSWAFNESGGFYNGSLLKLSHKNITGQLRNFHKTNKELDRALVNVLKRHAKAVKNTAKAYTPVRTGYMKDHVRIAWSPGGNTFEVGWDAADFQGIGYDGKPLRWYPPYVELGTEYMLGRGILIRAFEEHEPLIKPDMKAAIRTVLNRQALRRGGK